MTIDDLREECHGNGLMLHKCSEHHYQIHDDGGPLVDCWPTTNKYRRHDALETTKAKNGSAHQAVKHAMYLIGDGRKVAAPVVRSVVLPPSNGHSSIETPGAKASYTQEQARHFRHLLRLAMERLQFIGGDLNVSIVEEIHRAM